MLAINSNQGRWKRKFMTNITLKIDANKTKMKHLWNECIDKMKNGEKAQLGVTRTSLITLINHSRSKLVNVSLFQYILNVPAYKEKVMVSICYASCSHLCNESTAPLQQGENVASQWRAGEKKIMATTPSLKVHNLTYHIS